MPRKLQITLRVAGLALLVFAAGLFIIDVAHTLETQEHATPEGGYVIQHRFEIPRITSAVGLAGAVLFAVSFVRTQKTT